MIFIGDIHGDTKAWKQLIQGHDKTIQVGDFGAGFVPIPDPQDISVNHKFIRGNHDSLHACRNSSRWIPDGTYDPKHRMFLMGGAFSIDWQNRTPGVSWWGDEELSYQELYGMISRYEELKPQVMVTHDCPENMYFKLFPVETSKHHYPNRTSKALQAMLEIHQPKLWIFGHWHSFRNEVIDGTRFLCCDINQAINVDLPTYE